MSLGKIAVGSTGPAWTVQVMRSDNSPLPITGATITGAMRRHPVGTVLTLGGSYAITDGANGIFTYTPQTADVATVGFYKIAWSVVVGGLTYYVPDDITITDKY